MILRIAAARHSGVASLTRWARRRRAGLLEVLVEAFERDGLLMEECMVLGRSV